MQGRKILFVGYGSIGQGLTPLLFRHFDLNASQVRVVTGDPRGHEVAAEYGISFTINPLNPDNYEEILASYLKAGDLLINVSVDVSSVALIEWCQDHDVLYTDTCVEPWAGGYVSDKVHETTNYHLREHALSFRAVDNNQPTALIAHGANPGLVSHFVQAGLRKLAGELGFEPVGTSGDLARLLGIRTIHIAERDTQTDYQTLKPGEFSNTWSVDGLLSEGFQPAEMGWGTHEILPPQGGKLHHDVGAYLEQHSAEVKVQSWVPSMGAQDAYLITHHESLSIADHLSVYSKGELVYRPTVFYAYHPSPKTCQSLEQWVADGYQDPALKTVMTKEIITGYDELGVLFVFPGGSYWYGSTLEYNTAKTLVPHNSATSLQVTATMLGGITWMLANPKRGVVEAEDLDSNEILSVSLPYLGRVHGVMADWQPKGSYALQFEDYLLKE